MKYYIYRLSFPVGLHVGEKNLDESLPTICADTLFSALFIEALKKSEDAAAFLYQEAKAGRIVLSDLFPYIGDVNYLPKPMKKPDIIENEGNSNVKKAFKKLSYIPMDAVGKYLRGELDAQKENDILEELGESDLKTSVSIEEEGTMPYHVGIYRFKEKAGLYFIVGFDDESMVEKFTDLIGSLGFSGIGGKRSSGLGRFEARVKRLDGSCFEKEGAEYMSLSISLPREDELDEVLADAHYSVVKRGGFVQSESYAPENRKKKDLFLFSAGSCYTKRFEGDIYDVADGGNHPVYRYAKPLFWTL